MRVAITVDVQHNIAQIQNLSEILGQLKERPHAPLSNRAAQAIITNYIGELRAQIPKS